MTKDIVLVTVDALRADSSQTLEKTRSHFQDDYTGKCTTSGAATNWVFPSILAGSYYPEVYNDEGLPRDEFPTISGILADEGYETGAFLGFNPYLSKWEDEFDSFWNGGIDDAGENWYSNALEKWVSRGYRTLSLSKRVPGQTVVERAEKWYTNNSASPRFLWVHIMEPHKPYYPGLKRGREVGLGRAYKSIINLQRKNDELSRDDIKTQRELYEKCVELADEFVDSILSFVSDGSIIAVLGDHGEEFDHGHLGHERLYDECVRVPFFCKNNGLESRTDQIRQVDIPAELLSSAGFEIPSEWSSDELHTTEPAFMLSPWDGDGTFRYAIRTESEKLIQTFDLSTGESLKSEYYDLDSDPKEQTNLCGSTDTSDLEDQLREFIDRYSDALDIDPVTGIESSAVEERLENLGYK